MRKKKPLIGYYGGKYTIAPYIIKEIQQIPHHLYCEPFCGSASVLFQKPRELSEIEVLNDHDELLITIYRVAQTRKRLLIHRLRHTPFSYAEYRRATRIIKNRKNASLIDLAWAVIVHYRMSFGYRLNGGWRYGRKKGCQSVTIAWKNYLANIDEIFNRLDTVFFDCEDAIKCISRWDCEGALFYCDPPYPETCQGHYSGYSLTDWEQLCHTLDTIRGSYILSGYDQSIEPVSAQKKIRIPKRMTIALNNYHKTESMRKREEILWICKR